MKKKQPPIIGEKFRRWTVIGESFFSSPGHRSVPCRCDCGTERAVLVFALRNGDSNSCGCWRKERTKTIISETRWKNSHGRAAGAKDPLYRLWLSIKYRCYNQTATAYKWYGGRGISIYEPWRTNAEAFINYIETNLGPKPNGMSLDRIDNNGDYAPGNLRWATAKEQAANRREARN